MEDKKKTLTEYEKEISEAQEMEAVSYTHLDVYKRQHDSPAESFFF